MTAVEKYFQTQYRKDKEIIELIREKRRKFAQKYPMGQICNLSIDRFAITLGSKEQDCFCWDIYNLDYFGNMKASAMDFRNVFGVYANKAGERYRYSARYLQMRTDEKKPLFALVKEDIAELLDSAKLHKFKEIEKNGINDILKYKLISVYLPYDYLPFQSMDTYCKLLQIPVNKKDAFIIQVEKIQNVRDRSIGLRWMNNYVLICFMNWAIMHHVQLTEKDFTECPVKLTDKGLVNTSFKETIPPEIPREYFLHRNLSKKQLHILTHQYNTIPIYESKGEIDAPTWFQIYKWERKREKELAITKPDEEKELPVDSEEDCSEIDKITRHTTIPDEMALVTIASSGYTEEVEIYDIESVPTSWPGKNKSSNNLAEEGNSGTNLELRAGDTKRAEVNIRIGQNDFRDALLERYTKCCICQIHNAEFLIASHIKPWACSSSEEKTDIDNGFIMCPNHDLLFDRGYISFDDEGYLLISKDIDEINQIQMNVSKETRIMLTEGNRKYLKYHRENIFKV